MKNKLLLLASVLFMATGSYAQVFPESFEGNWTDLNPPSSAGGTAGPLGWMIANQGDNEIVWQQTAVNANFGSHAAYLAEDTVADGTTASDWLISSGLPLFAENVAFQFFSKMGTPGDQGGTYKLMVTTGAQDVLNLYTVLQQWTEAELNPVQNQYNKITVMLPDNLIGQVLHFALVREGATADAWYVDDLTAFPVCSPPTNITTVSATETTVTVAWDGMDATQWDIEIEPISGAPTGIPSINVSVPTATFTGLVPGAEYKIYVRATCADGGHSDWVGPYPFSTQTTNPLTGILRYDSNGDGICNDQDNGIANAEILITVNENDPVSAYTNAQGHYALYNLPLGDNTLLFQVLPPAGFAEIPASTQTLTITETGAVVDFCLPQPVQQITDVSVQLIPINNAVPGFDAYYQVIVNNNGSVPVSGAMVTVIFNDDRLNFVSADPAVSVNGNILTYTFDSAAYSSLFSTLKFHVEQPPVNIGGETLLFTAAISEVAGDAVPEDNSAVLNQLVVNSWDPNDILVREGDYINGFQALEYLHYTIRFQNTGTADATNIRIGNIMGDKLDWDTFELTGASHDFAATRNGGEVEFKFNNIHLAASTVDEVASHGYVSYRVKPKAGVVVGDIMTNDANIFFDFNPAVATNTATTEIEGVTGLNDNTVSGIKVYPNPVKNMLYIGLQNQLLQSVAVYDINGRLCLTSATATVSVQSLQPGMYFVKITTDRGMENYKIIKE